MGELFTTYKEALMQIAILMGLVCVIAIMATITIEIIRRVLRNVRSKYVEDESSAKEPKKKSNYVLTSILVAAGIAFFFVILVIVANKEWGLSLQPDHVVLTFVGIIATFLVVTNYAQVSDIKKEMEDRISRIENAQQSLIRRIIKEQRKERKNKEEEEENND